MNQLTLVNVSTVNCDNTLVDPFNNASLYDTNFVGAENGWPPIITSRATEEESLTTLEESRSAVGELKNTFDESLANPIDLGSTEELLRLSPDAWPSGDLNFEDFNDDLRGNMITTLLDNIQIKSKILIHNEECYPLWVYYYNYSVCWDRTKITDDINYVHHLFFSEFNAYKQFRTS